MVRRGPVDGSPNTSQHAPQQCRTDLHERILFAGHNGVAELQAVGLFERHRQHAAVAKAHNLRADRASASGLNLTNIAEPTGGPTPLPEQAPYPRPPARSPSSKP